MLRSSGLATVTHLASTPRNRYAFSWSAVPLSRSVSLVFIYSCPSSSPIKYRMLYSAGSGTTQQRIQEWFASTALATHFSPRKIETSDPRELTEDYIVEELGLEGSDPEKVGRNNDPSGVNEVLKPFARPRGPPRRR